MSKKVATATNKNLIRWLAKLVMEYHDLHGEACSLDPKDAKTYFTMKFPMIQGMENQSILRKIGNMNINTKQIKQEALEELKCTKDQKQ